MKEFKFKGRVALSEIREVAKKIKKEEGDVSIDFSSCNVGFQVIKVIVEAIAGLNNHVVLNLSYTQAGCRSANYLASMIKQFKGSLSLDISGNKFEDRSLGHLILRLVESNRLVKLRFHDVDINTSTYTEIIDAIINSKTNLDLAFDYYKLSREQAEGIDRAVRDAKIEVTLKFSSGLNVVELSAENACVDSVILQPSLVKIPLSLYQSNNKDAIDNLMLILQSSRFSVYVEVDFPPEDKLKGESFNEEVLKSVLELKPVVEEKIYWESRKIYGSSYFSESYIDEELLLRNKMFYESIAALGRKNQIFPNARLKDFLTHITRLISPEEIMNSINRFTNYFTKETFASLGWSIALHISEDKLEKLKFMHQIVHGVSGLEFALFINRLKECIHLDSYMKQEKWDAVKFIIFPFEGNPVYLEPISCDVDGSEAYKEVAYYFWASCETCLFPTEILEKLFSKLSLGKMLAILEDSLSALKEKYSKLLEENPSASNSTEISESSKSSEDTESEINDDGSNGDSGNGGTGGKGEANSLSQDMHDVGGNFFDFRMPELSQLILFVSKEFIEENNKEEKERLESIIDLEDSLMYEARVKNSSDNEIFDHEYHYKGDGLKGIVGEYFDPISISA